MNHFVKTFCTMHVSFDVGLNFPLGLFLFSFCNFSLRCFEVNGKAPTVITEVESFKLSFACLHVGMKPVVFFFFFAGIIVMTKQNLFH